ncbi:hypothetical protein HYG77_20440 [Rhodococcus sp. ZPP]|uniref:hypothetical protein n=1 Tax=Rhodococcus sp. ZPP TaxID=2749906 RepID=UPI001AD85677|nr:hypothetical protein [Rhodococcus sp. ZPP]QTJ67728.1 hypothetical protein HYG77_20440 [Rhodococcus sp. ZPP]
MRSRAADVGDDRRGGSVGDLGGSSRSGTVPGGAVVSVTSSSPHPFRLVIWSRLGS